MGISRKITAILASRKFFWAVIIFIVIEGLWVAFSAVYPMAFDEDFHFGIIKIYANHLLPFLPGQPDNASQFSAVARDPSFLYHYLMSFPYRIIAAITDSQTAQVILLRIINVGIFTASLLLFAKMFKKVGTSPALANTALAIFALIPIVPLMAGQINYDNLFMAWTAWLLLLGYDLLTQLKRHELSLKTASWFVLVCMFGSLTKYAFLPIAFSAVVFLVIFGFIHNRKSGRKLLKSLDASHKSMGSIKLGVVVLFVIGLSMFVQRYGVNLVKYHTFLPDCAAVLSVNECKKYGPWERNYRFSLDKGHVDPNIIWYANQWQKGMVKRLFFVIAGPNQGYANYLPVPLPKAAFIVLAVSGFLVVIVLARRIFSGSPFLLFSLITSAAYILVLFFLSNYRDYLGTGRVVAVNGRYLIPILLPLAAIVGKGFSIALHKWPATKPWLAVVAILMFLQAGGIFSFISRSDHTWYWPNDIVVNTNNAARKIFDPVMYQGPKEN